MQPNGTRRSARFLQAQNFSGLPFSWAVLLAATIQVAVFCAAPSAAQAQKAPEGWVEAEASQGQVAVYLHAESLAVIEVMRTPMTSSAMPAWLTNLKAQLKHQKIPIQKSEDLSLGNAKAQLFHMRQKIRGETFEVRLMVFLRAGKLWQISQTFQTLEGHDEASFQQDLLAVAKTLP